MDKTNPPTRLEFLTLESVQEQIQRENTVFKQENVTQPKVRQGELSEERSAVQSQLAPRANNRTLSPRSNSHVSLHSELSSTWLDARAANPIAHGFNLIAAGNPGIGSVLNFGQIHTPPEFESECSDPGILIIVALSQQVILDDLLALRPEHVFNEGMSGAIGPHDSANFGETLRQIVIQGPFANYRPGMLLTPRQVSLLAEHGAARVYHRLVPLSTVHGTTTEEANNSVVAYVENNMDRLKNGHASETDEDKKIFMEEREALAVNLIRAFLDNAPDQTIALIFGAKHSFADSFDAAGCSPQIFYKPPTHNFPQALKKETAISLENSSEDDSIAADFRHDKDDENLSEEDRLSLDKFLEEYPNSIGNLLARGTRADIEHVLTMVPDHEKALKMLSKFKD